MTEKNIQKQEFMNDMNGNRNDNKVIERDKQLKNLRHNLLLIRETYRMFHASQTSMKKFYEALGVTDDIYSIFLNGSTISAHQHKYLVDVLASCGINKKYLSKTRPPKIFSAKDLNLLVDEYLYAPTKEVKDLILKDIRKELEFNWRDDNKSMAMLVDSVYCLKMKAEGTTEFDLHRGREILNAIANYNFSNVTLNSKEYAGFVNELAKTINTIEKDFPAFYAVAQQMKKKKTPESIMHDIAYNLELLNNMIISKESANSQSCLNMLKEISNVMLKIFLIMNTP